MKSKRRNARPVRHGLGLLVATTALTAGLLMTSTVAGATVTTLFVDGANVACSDAGTGAVEAPFCTIKRAAVVARSGQTVIVASGAYGGDIVAAASGTALAPIVFTTAPGATVTVANGVYGFKVSSKSWIVIDGFAVSGTTNTGVYVTTSNNITLRNNHVSNAGKPISGATARGIRLNATSNSTVTRNTTDHNSDAGIALSGASNSNVISQNTSFNNARGYTRAAAGFDLRDGAGNIVGANVSHDNEDSGFNIWTGTSAAVVSNNLAYRNGDHGIDVHNATNAQIVSNTVTGNIDSGIEMTTSTGTSLANNIATDNGINSPRTSGNIRADAPSIGSTTLDFDLLNLRVPGVMIDWAGAKYTSLAAFQAATGREPNGLQSDPLFASANAADFRLLAGSRAIDAANSGAAGEPNQDASGHDRVDDPATVNTGTGSISYADRGAFEYLLG